MGPEWVEERRGPASAAPVNVPPLPAAVGSWKAPWSGWELWALKGVLWGSMLLSVLVTVSAPMREQFQRWARASHEGGARYPGEMPEVQGRLVFELGWKLNPFSGAPTIFVLCAGFLAVIYIGERLLLRVARAPAARG